MLISLQTMLEIWYASPYWDPQSDAWYVREVQHIHLQKKFISSSMHCLNENINELKCWLRVDCSSWGAHEDKTTADKGCNCHAISRFL